jgi:hypothetical protein
MAPGQSYWPAAQLVLPNKRSHTSANGLVLGSGDRFQRRDAHSAIGKVLVHQSGFSQARFPQVRFSGEETATALTVHGAPPLQDCIEPVFKTVEKTDADKLNTAMELSHWLETTLRKKDVRVAVISRTGTERVEQYDPTGMLHTGLAVYSPEDQTWHVYNLINHIQGAEPQAGIWKNSLVDFFYEQPINKKDALVMIPPRDIQEKMWKAFQSGEYKSLYFTRDYNMVSVPHTTRSLNCTKWSLMNIIAANIQNYDPKTVLKAIQERFKSGVLEVHPVVRPFVKRQPFILQDEVPMWEPVQTVTVGSLYHSDLFEEKHFYSKRELLSKPGETPSLTISLYIPLAAGGLMLFPAIRYILKQTFLKKMNRWLAALPQRLRTIQESVLS